MKRTDILKDTLSCRIHPQLKEELSSEAYANGHTTSAYVEDLLFNRHQIIENDAKDYHEKFYLAQEELENLSQQYNEEVGNLNHRLSESNQYVEKFRKLEADLQERQNYANGLKEQNEQLENQLNEVTNKLQNLENENAQISQQQENVKIAKEEETPEESSSGNWKLLLGIFIAVVLSVIGFRVFGKKTPTPAVAQVQNNNNNISPIGYPYLQ